MEHKFEGTDKEWFAESVNMQHFVIKHNYSGAAIALVYKNNESVYCNEGWYNVSVIANSLLSLKQHMKELEYLKELHITLKTLELTNNAMLSKFEKLIKEKELIITKSLRRG